MAAKKPPMTLKKMRKNQGLMNAREFAAAVGVHYATILKRLKDRNISFTMLDPKGRYLFSPNDVLLFQKWQRGFEDRDPRHYGKGEVRMVFNLLRQGKTPYDISLENSIHPKLLTRIISDLERLRAGLFLPSDVMEKINKMPLDGVFPLETPEDFLGVFEDALKKRMCQKCGENRCRVCVPCAKAYGKQENKTPKAPHPTRGEAPLPRVLQEPVPEGFEEFVED